MLRDINSSNYDQTTFDLIKDKKLNFPSLGVTSLPLMSMQAEYFFRNHQYEKSIEFLYESQDVNPYIGLTEHYLSINYDRLGIKDSFYINAKKAFKKIPNNDAHFGYYAKALNQRGQTDSIIIEFEKIKDKKMPKVWTYFLSSLTSKDGYDSILKVYGNEARKIFKSPSEELDLIINYSIYGRDNMLKADSLFDIANDLVIKEQYEKSFEYYTNAIEIYPNNHLYYENLGIAYSKDNQFKKGLEYFKYVIDNINPKNGKNEFYASLAYFNMKNEEKGCEFLNEALKFNYGPAIQLNKQKCRK